MRQAVELVRTGGLSINLASQQCNVPYSSLYGRVRKNRRDNPAEWEGVNEAQINEPSSAVSSSSSGANGGGGSSVSEYSFPSAALSSLALAAASARPDVSVTIRPTPQHATT